MRQLSQYLVGYALIVLLVVLVTAGIIAVFSPRRRTRMLHIAAWAIGGVAGTYALVRGIAEFFIIHYNDPASYRSSWGGPSLVGVFLVHSGPGFVALLAVGEYARRRLRTPRNAT